MCGISGLVNCGDSATLARMTHVQAHRGPDDAGVWERRFPDGTYIGLGSQRLAILDLSPAGHMPMPNEDGTLWITYNGEIYNFAELRHELESKGHDFRSRTDSEVVLHLYEEEGADCVNRLNGMFAFAICDFRTGRPEVFLARDHFGIKPLYYTQQGPGLAFASEVKSLLLVPGIDAAMDFQALHEYLTFLWVPDPKTMFRGIFKLPAGHFALLRDGEFHVQQYWDLAFPPSATRYACSEEELIDEVRARFRRSVQSQMISDVPLGSFLSAGLDSSSIVAMMAEATAQSLRTYTVTFPRRYRMGENTLDDPAVASRFAKNLGCDNRQILVEPDVVSLLPQLTWHMDEPVADPAIIPAFLVCREASREVSVLLSGVGGDELFAGYRKYCAHYWGQAYRKLVPSLLHNRVIAPAVSALPSLRGTPFKGMIRLAKKMARSGSLSSRDSFIMNATYLDDPEKAALYAPEMAREIAGSSAAAAHHACFDQVSHADFLHQMLYLDAKIFMVSLNLTYNDKMSMASSVEVRVPFLDRELVEFVALNVPPELLLKGKLRPTTKYIFRRAMEGILPPEVLNQPKAGFGAPVDYWLAQDLRGMVDDLLCESQVRSRGLLRPEAVRELVKKHRRGRDYSMQLWQLLTLELWMETFLDGAVESRAPSQEQVRVAKAHSHWVTSQPGFSRAVS
jgi:asparagine synthase (glutamine-hydrolysing)